MDAFRRLEAILVARAGQSSKLNLRSVAVPRPLGISMMLAGMTGDHQRLAWSIVACCADPKVKLRMTAGGLAYTIDKAALMIRSGNRLDNAERDLAAVVERAVMRSRDPALDGKPLFAGMTYARGERKRRGGKITVRMGDEALGLMSKTDVARVPVDLWRGINRQVAFALLVRNYCDLGLVLEDPTPRANMSSWTFRKDELGWWSEAASTMTMGRFARDYLRPAIGALNELDMGSLIEHRLVTSSSEVTAEARPKAVESIRYRIEIGEGGDVKKTMQRQVSARWNNMDADDLKNERSKQMKGDFAKRAKEKRATDRLRAEIRPKLEEKLKAEVEAKLRVELEAKLRAEYAARIEREGVAWLAKTGPAPVAVAKPVNAGPPRRPGLSR